MPASLDLFQLDTIYPIPQQPPCPMVGSQESLEAGSSWKREEVSFPNKSAMQNIQMLFFWCFSQCYVFHTMHTYNAFQSNEQSVAELMFFSGTAEAWQ